jgi:hypothetical protein
MEKLEARHPLRKVFSLGVREFIRPHSTHPLSVCDPFFPYRISQRNESISLLVLTTKRTSG